MVDMLESLQLLATDSTRHRAKADRATQRSAFRDIQSSIVDKESPRLDFQIRNQPISFDSWRKIKTWHGFKNVIGEGLDVHCMENELVADIFEIYIEDHGSKGVDSRYMDTTLGKSRAINRRKDRVHKSQEQI
jgi:hypothetical protein